MEELISGLIESGVIDAEAAQFLRRQLDPQAARLDAENQFYNSILGALQNQQAKLVSGPEDNLTLSFVRDIFDESEGDLAEAVFGTIEDIASERAITQTVSVSTSLQGKVLEDAFLRVNEEVLSWANEYYTSLRDDDHGSLPNLNRTSRSQFLDIFELWNRGELPIQRDGGNRGLPTLIEAIEPVFGPTRAERIASTEVTRIFGEATKAAGRSSDVVTRLRWSTSQDERVCPQCGPLHNTTVDVNEDTFPHPELANQTFPAHPRCRCDLLLETELAQ